MALVKEFAAAACFAFLLMLLCLLELLLLLWHSLCLELLHRLAIDLLSLVMQKSALALSKHLALCAVFAGPFA